MTKVFVYMAGAFIIMVLGVYQYSSNHGSDKNVSRTIQIKGVFLLVNQQDLLSRLNRLSLDYPEQSNFVSKVLTMLEDEPYVSSSSIRYTWPNTMTIEIVEIAPLAIVNDRYLLLKECRLIPYDPATIDVSAQALYLEGDTVDAVQCRDINKALTDLKPLAADSISIQSNGDYVLKFVGTSVVVDNEELVSRLTVVAEIANRIRKDEINALYLDTRYVSGAAIAQVAEL